MATHMSNDKYLIGSEDKLELSMNITNDGKKAIQGYQKLAAHTASETEFLRSFDVLVVCRHFLSRTCQNLKIVFNFLFLKMLPVLSLNFREIVPFFLWLSV